MRRWTTLLTSGLLTVSTLLTSCGGDDATAPTSSDGTTTAGTRPTAAFSVSPASPTAAQTVTFTDQSTGSPTSWSWSFGDGGSSTAQSPTHAFSAAGSYTVKLTAVNGAGRDSTSKAVTVAAASGPSAFAPTWVKIPGGTFSMGDHHSFVDPEHPSDELPLHDVTLSSFYMSTTLVTNSEYVAYLNSAMKSGLIEVRSGVVYATGGANPFVYTSSAVPRSSIVYADGTFTIKSGRDLHPVVGVRWFGAAAFANWLSVRDGYTPCYDLTTGACDVTTGTGYRLPTEAEWEYAGRGGQTNPYRQFPWGDDTNADGRISNWEGSGDPWEAGDIPRTTPVGFYNGSVRQKSDYDWPGSMTTYQTRAGSNAFGLYDMGGNVWQWINDWYSNSYYQHCVTNSITSNPPGPASGDVFTDHGNMAYRGLRGGTWYNGGGQQFYGYARVSNRDPSWSLGPAMDSTPESSWLQVGFRLIRPNRSSSNVTRTVGLMLNTAKAHTGYTLLSPMHSPENYLINNAGQYIHKWTAVGEPGRSSYLLENGHLIRARAMGGVGPNTGGGEGGRIEEYDWDGNLVWAYDYYSSTYIAHHDFKVLPNGNVIIVAAEKKTYAEVIQAGFNPANLDPSITGTNGFMLPDYVIEVKPTRPSGGTIVWEWHIWDHLVQDFSASKDNYGTVANHPELVDPNGGGSGKIPQFWNHVNGVDYNAQLDQIMISVRGNSELIVIDHGTTTAEAKGHTGGTLGKGGDLVYRWGNAQQYDRGTTSDRKLYQQHHTTWIEPGLPGAGNILIFNNGIGRNYSSVDQIVPPVNADGSYTLASSAAYGPSSPTWTYVASPPTSFYSAEISGAQRLPNGNTLITSGVNGVLFEVTSAGEVVWQYVNPVTTAPLAQGAAIPADAARAGQYMNAVFRVTRYAPDYLGLAGRTLTPIGTIETYSSSVGQAGSGRRE
jgi:formylglycine-generating enzyme required for sulfatase activity